MLPQINAQWSELVHKSGREDLERIIILVRGQDLRAENIVFERKISAENALGFAAEIREAFELHQSELSDEADQNTWEDENGLWLWCVFPNKADGSMANFPHDFKADWELENELIDILDRN